MSSDVATRVTRKLDVRVKKHLDGKGQFWLVFRYFALTILFVIAALPIYIMVINSVKGITGVTQSAAFTPPTSLNFEAWGPTWEVLRTNAAHTLLRNSVFNHFCGYWRHQWLCLCQVEVPWIELDLYYIPLRYVHSLPSNHDSTYQVQPMGWNRRQYLRIGICARHLRYSNLYLDLP